jgi:hypothetical protein
MAASAPAASALGATRARCFCKHCCTRERIVTANRGQIFSRTVRAAFRATGRSSRNSSQLAGWASHLLCHFCCDVLVVSADVVGIDLVGNLVDDIRYC